MPNQTVHEFRSPAVTESASSDAPFFATGNVISICESPVFARNTPTERQESNPDGLGCARGLRSAFLLEAGMFLLAYGIWHLCHLAH